MSRSWGRLVVKGLEVTAREGVRSAVRKTASKLLPRWWATWTEANVYSKWMKTIEPRRMQAVRATLDAGFSYQPLISVLMPTFDADPSLILAAIESLERQWYPVWELCCADGGSTKPDVMRVLEKARLDCRCKIRFLESNGGIAANTNACLEMATGEFVTFLDHDDLLAPHALAAVVRELNARKELDLVYSDRDLLTSNGRRHDPLFKPDWSPEILLSSNYLAHMLVIRRALLSQVGPFDPQCDGAQDWDIVWRAVERTVPERIGHVPEILYHWRDIPGSSATTMDAKPYARKAELRAINAHLRRVDWPAEAVYDATGFIRIEWVSNPRSKASVIIPNRDRPELLRACVHSILARTKAVEFEILIVENGSVRPETFRLYSELSASGPVRVIAYEHPFNYSAALNFAARQASGDVLVFLNNDTEVLDDGCLRELVSWAERPEVGLVGAKLLRPHGTIQHAGVTVGLHGLAGHVFAGCPEGFFGCYGTPEWYRNYLSVTGACQAIRRTVFEELGGYDETFMLNGSDVELGIRIVEKGLRVVYDPFARLLHHEGATHGGHIPLTDFDVSLEKYEPFLERGDPFYNPNLSYEDVVPRPAVARDRAPAVLSQAFRRQLRPRDGHSNAALRP